MSDASPRSPSRKPFPKTTSPNPNQELNPSGRPSLDTSRQNRVASSSRSVHANPHALRAVEGLNLLAQHAHQNTINPTAPHTGSGVDGRTTLPSSTTLQSPEIAIPFNYNTPTPPFRTELTHQYARHQPIASSSRGQTYDRGGGQEEGREGEQEHGTLVIGEGGRSRWLGAAAGTEWLFDVSLVDIALGGLFRLVSPT